MRWSECFRRDLAARPACAPALSCWPARVCWTDAARPPIGDTQPGCSANILRSGSKPITSSSRGVLVLRGRKGRYRLCLGARRGRFRLRTLSRRRPGTRGVPPTTWRTTAILGHAGARTLVGPHSARLGLRARETSRSDERRYPGRGGVPLGTSVRSSVSRRDWRNPARAIERLRAEAARVRLENGREPVEVAGAAVGFSDPERIRRAFLRVNGQLPQALRRAAQIRSGAR